MIFKVFAKFKRRDYSGTMRGLVITTLFFVFSLSYTGAWWPDKLPKVHYKDQYYCKDKQDGTAVDCRDDCDHHCVKACGPGACFRVYTVRPRFDNT